MLLGALRGGNPVERIVAKPLNCHSRANSRETGSWEMSHYGSVRFAGNAVEDHA